MTKSYIPLLSLFALSNCTAASGPLPSLSARPANYLQLGLLVDSFDYSEVWTPPAKSNESGWMGGLSLRYTYHGVQIPLYGKLDLEFVEARSDYDGGITRNDGTFIGISALTRNIFKRVEANLGYCFNNVGGVPLDLVGYTGLGYRFWRRNLAFGLPVDYIEDYSWKYVPVGIRGEYSFDGHWSVALDIAARFMFGGNLSVMELFGSPSFELGNVTGSKIALPVSFRFSKLWMLSLETWYETSGIDQSNPVEAENGHVLLEPSSSTHIFGLTLSAGLTL